MLPISNSAPPQLAAFQVDLGVSIVWKMAFMMSSLPFEIYVKCAEVKTERGGFIFSL